VNKSVLFRILTSLCEVHEGTEEVGKMGWKVAFGVGSPISDVLKDIEIEIQEKPGI
jgi:hypothetical protein